MNSILYLFHLEILLFRDSPCCRDRVTLVGIGLGVGLCDPHKHKRMHATKIPIKATLLINELCRIALALRHSLDSLCDPRKSLFVGLAPVFLPPTCLR